MTTAPQMVMVTVAEKRSLIVNVFAGHRREGDELVPVFMQRQVLPGETCEVPEDEVAQLLANGFIVDPDAPASTMMVQDGRPPEDGMVRMGMP